jgi:hypothetical protein
MEQCVWFKNIVHGLRNHNAMLRHGDGAGASKPVYPAQFAGNVVYGYLFCVKIERINPCARHGHVYLVFW